MAPRSDMNRKCMFKLMTVKTITITTDAYERLKAVKMDGESFSQTIKRITARPPLISFFGTLSPESGAKLGRAIEENRKVRREIDERR